MVRFLVLSWAVARVAGFELGCGAGPWFCVGLWCGLLVLSWAVVWVPGFELGCGAGSWFELGCGVGRWL